MWWRRRKGAVGRRRASVRGHSCCLRRESENAREDGCLYGCTKSVETKINKQKRGPEAYNLAELLIAQHTQSCFSRRARFVTVRWLGTRPDWCWRVSRWWWPVGRSSPPLDWRSWSVPLTSDESHWSWHLDGRWCSQSTVSKNSKIVKHYDHFK